MQQDNRKGLLLQQVPHLAPHTVRSLPAACVCFGMVEWWVAPICLSMVPSMLLFLFLIVGACWCDRVTGLSTWDFPGSVAGNG